MNVNAAKRSWVDPNRRTVLVVGDGDKVEQRLVQLGDSDGDMVIVTNGLRPGDRIITGQLQKLRPGMPVQVEAGKNMRTSAWDSTCGPPGHPWLGESDPAKAIAHTGQRVTHKQVMVNALRALLEQRAAA